MKNIIYYKKGDVALIGTHFNFKKFSTWVPSLFQKISHKFHKLGIISFTKEGLPTLIVREKGRIKEYLLGEFVHNHPDFYVHILRMYKKHKNLKEHQISNRIFDILHVNNHKKFFSALKNKFISKEKSLKSDFDLDHIFQCFKENKDTRLFLFKNWENFQKKFYHVKLLNKKTV